MKTVATNRASSHVANLQKRQHAASSRRYERLVAAASLILLAAALWTAWSLWQSHQRTIRSIEVRAGAELLESEPPAIRIAHALWLADQGDNAAALELYRLVEGENPDAPIARIARFNSANLHLRDAMTLMATNERGRALALVEIAKQLYRGLLRDKPDDWDVRYNLSRALLLIPDAMDDTALSATPEAAERAATTMKGYSPGLP